MKFATFAALVASATFASVKAHATVQYVWLNGVDQGFGQNLYIRAPDNNNPVKDLTSSAVTCNTKPGAVPNTIDVKAGDTVSFEWHHESRSSSDQIIDPSHKGPVQVYIAPTSSNGQGDVWVKVFEEDYRDGSWAVDKLIAARGLHSIIIPNLAAGTYLLRPEILGLHEADTLYTQNPARGIQLFHECVQIRVTSSGSVSLPAGISLPGAYKDNSPGILFNLYGGSAIFPSYKAPGGDVWSGAAGGSIGMTVAPVATTQTTSAQTTKATTTSVAPVPTTTSSTKTTSVAPVPTTTTKTTVAQTTKATTSTTSVVAVPTTTTATNPSAQVATEWQQCAGNGFATRTCAQGLTCKFWNDYYSQCLRA